MTRTPYLLLLSLLCSSSLNAAPGNTQLEISKNKAIIDKLKNNTGLSPTKAMPELSIEHFSFVPSTVKNGQGFMYQLSVKNNGGTATSDMMWVGFNQTPQMGLPQQVKVPAAGQTLSYKGEIGNSPRTCGSITYTATVDTQNVVKESNENNNTATATITVNPRSDLGVCEYTGHCPKLSTAGKVNKDIILNVDVTNYGCIANTPARIWINCPDQWPTPADIPAIEPGKFWSHSVSFKWTTPGTRTCKIIVDSEKVLDEANEINNRNDFTVNVVN